MNHGVKTAGNTPGTSENLVVARLLALIAVVLISITAVDLLILSSAEAMVEHSTHYRMRVVRDFHRDTQTSSPGLVLAVGDSLTMSCFNANEFEALSENGIRAYNLGLSGKAMPELMFDAPFPALKDATVVTCVSPVTTFNATSLDIYPRKANLYRLMDWPYSLDRFSLYLKLVPSSNAEYVMLPRWAQALEGRWLVSDWMLRRVKQTGRNAINMARGKKPVWTVSHTSYETDLKYPGWDGTSAHGNFEAHYQSVMADQPALVDGRFTPSAEMLTAYDCTFGFLRDHSRRLVIVLTPIHPVMRERLGPQVISGFRDCIEELEGVEVIDLTGLLDGEDFRDALHVRNESSAKVTRAIHAALEAGDG